MDFNPLEEFEKLRVLDIRKAGALLDTFPAPPAIITAARLTL